MKRYFIGIVSTIILIITLCSCSTDSNNANNKMIKLTKISYMEHPEMMTNSTQLYSTLNGYYMGKEIYVNIDNIIAIYPEDITTNDGTTKTISTIYCTNTVVSNHYIKVKESPEEVKALIEN